MIWLGPILESFFPVVVVDHVVNFYLMGLLVIGTGLKVSVNRYPVDVVGRPISVLILDRLCIEREL